MFPGGRDTLCTLQGIVSLKLSTAHCLKTGTHLAWQKMMTSDAIPGCKLEARAVPASQDLCGRLMASGIPSPTAGAMSFQSDL